MSYFTNGVVDDVLCAEKIHSIPSWWLHNTKQGHESTKLDEANPSSCQWWETRGGGEEGGALDNQTQDSSGTISAPIPSASAFLISSLPKLEEFM